MLLRSWNCYLLIPQQLQHRKGLSFWSEELKHGFAQPQRLLASTHCQFSMPISPWLIQLIWLRSQMNSHQNAILENLFSGGFKLTFKFDWKRLFKFYPILIFVFSLFWRIESFKTQVDETWIPNSLISALQLAYFNSRNIRKTLRLRSRAFWI